MKEKALRYLSISEEVSYADDENPILSITLVVFNIHSMGNVVYDCPSIHSRTYSFLVDIVRQYVYSSKISEPFEGTESVIFEVLIEDEPSKIFLAPTPTGAWSCVIRLVNELRNKGAANFSSRANYFEISNLIY